VKLFLDFDAIREGNDKRRVNMTIGWWNLFLLFLRFESRGNRTVFAGKSRDGKWLIIFAAEALRPFRGLKRAILGIMRHSARVDSF
jgi:hypothetical protein